MAQIDFTVEKNTIESIKNQIKLILSEQETNIRPCNTSSESSLPLVKEQFLEIKIGLEQQRDGAVFSAKEVIDSLR